MQNEYSSDHEKKKLKIDRKKVIVCAIIVALLCSLSVGMLVAKYLSERNTNGLVRANNFYFTSNLLDGKAHTLAPGTTSVTFTLGNHADDLRYSEVDISYEVTVNNGATVTNGSGTLTKGDVNDAQVTISGLAAGTYEVEAKAVGGGTATGTGGYTKTLTATLEVPEEKADLYYNIDASAGDYTLLTVWNEGDAAGNVTITYTGIPDNTNPNMTDWTTNSSKEVTIASHESKVFRFFGETVTVSVSGAMEKLLN